MDDFLAQLYGTDELVKEAAADTPSTESPDGELEKMAADQFVNWAIEEGIDLSKVADDQVTEAFMEFREGFMAKAAEAAETEGGEDTEGQEKFAEADAFGRIMAHAYVNELSSIEKEAGVGAKARGFAGKVFGKNLKTLKSYAEKNPAYKPLYEAALKETKKARGTAAFGAGAAGAVGAQVGGGVAAAKALKGMQKKEGADEEAYETLVATRATEMLKAAGYEVPADEPTDEEKLAYQVEHDALTLLEETGFPIEWAQ